MWQTLVAFSSNGGLPSIASTVETELANARSALPASIALTLAMPAPGMTWSEVSGTACSTTFLIAPPMGYHEPPWGPVMKRRLSADAVPAPSATAAHTALVSKVCRVISRCLHFSGCVLAAIAADERPDMLGRRPR